MVQATFKPEFLNRLDDVILFDSLTTEELSQIVDLQVARLAGGSPIAGSTLQVTAGGPGVAGADRLRPDLRRAAAAQADPVRDRRPAGPGPAVRRRSCDGDDVLVDLDPASDTLTVRRAQLSAGRAVAGPDGSSSSSRS